MTAGSPGQRGLSGPRTFAIFGYRERGDEASAMLGLDGRNFRRLVTDCATLNFFVLFLYKLRNI